MLLVVNASLPAQTVRRLIDLAKQPGARMSYGSSGRGNATHLAGELFNVPGMEMDPRWYGVFAPARTSDAVVTGMHAAVVKALSNNAVRDRLAALGVQPVGNYPAQFSIFVRGAIARAAELTRLAGIEPE
jgi:tripartite-type tricarboxylate transporter receptor subunit TctC